MNIKHPSCFTLLALLLFAPCKRTLTQELPEQILSASRFVLGADLSFVSAVEDAGGRYFDGGSRVDPFRLFRSNGTNTARVRLWHTPNWQKKYNKGRIYSGLADVEKTMRRAVGAGMSVMLDIHYSDTWADPGNQAIPAAWNRLDLALLNDSVYAYTLRVLQYFEERGLTPDMVQVGNETNHGMLWPLGSTREGSWRNFGTLVNSGIRAIREFSRVAGKKPRIILHTAQLHKAGAWTDSLIREGLVNDFDILGLSHYYQWSRVSTMQGVSDSIAALKKRFDKAIMVVETAFPWTWNNADSYPNIISAVNLPAGFEVSPAGQLRYLEALTQAIITGGGSGLVYWEPAWISAARQDPWGTGSAWDNATFFDAKGNVLPAIRYSLSEYAFPLIQ